VNGAVFTRVHVTRSGPFLESYLSKIGLEQFIPVVSRIVHFTRYELNIEHIELDDPKAGVHKLVSDAPHWSHNGH
jgi:hypothetical protein